MRTTSLQVSGHKFLLRRLELALVIGDPRMAHDPLRSQRRAIFVGLLISALIAGGAVMLGLLRLAPSIDGATLVADEHGSLHVRLEDGFHPISNVASARLVLRQPVEVKQSTCAQLQGEHMREPMGIGHVPGLNPAPERQWLTCDGKHNVQVFAVEETTPHERVVVRSGSDVWLVEGTMRSLADPAAARALGAVEVPMSRELVETLDEHADSLLPHGRSGLPKPFETAGTVVHAGSRSFLVGHGGVMELTGARADYALSLSPHPDVYAELGEVMALPTRDLLPNIPAERVDWSAPERACVGAEGMAEPRGAVAVDANNHREQAVVSANISASGSTGNGGSRFVGPQATSALLTEHGFVLVDANGTRFSLDRAEDLRALGFENHVYVPWRVVRSLPDGGVLSEANARAMRPTTSTTETIAESPKATE